MMPLRTVKRSKYGVRTDEIGKLERTCDGILFDSKRECERYGELKLLERAGELANLKLQEALPLSVAGKIIGRYEADFAYATRTEQLVLEDVKSKATRTPIYRWKKKHVAAQYGIQIREVE